MTVASISASMPSSPAVVRHAVTDACPFATHFRGIAQATGARLGHVVIDIPDDDEVRVDVPEEEMLRHDLEKLFAPLRSKENTQEIDGFIRDRAKRLTAEGIDSGRLRQLIGGVERRDRSMSLFHGAVQGGAPFACASLIFDLFMAKPILEQVGGNLAELGAAAGAFQGAMDVVFGRALQEPFSGAYYTRVTSPQASTEGVPGISERMWHLMCGLAVPYSVRNVVRAVVDVGLVAASGPGAGITANLIIDSIGGLAAGAATRHMLGGHENRSAACLLARDDWMEVLAASDQSVSLASIRHAGGAVISGAAKAALAIPSGIAALGSPSGLAGMGILTGGLAVLVPAQAAAGKALATYGPIAQEACLRAVNVVGSAILYASLGAGLVLAGEPERLKGVWS